MSLIRAIALGTLGCLVAGESKAEPIYAYKVASNRLIAFDSARPSVLTTDLPVAGIAAGETLVGIDFRPQNGQLYGLGVDAAANTATLYSVSLQTGFAGAVGTPGSVALVDAGNFPIDLPDPGTQSYGFDFNPTADRARVTTATGLNFRVNPSNGAAVDGNGGALGVQPDANINGSGVLGVAATAYTNNQPNGFVVTQYTLDHVSNALYIQNTPNGGTQTLGQTVFLSGSPLDFSAINGFDIPAGVNANLNNSAVLAGSAYAALGVGGLNGLYRINLTNAVATLAGPIDSGAAPIQGLAAQPGLPRALIGLGGSGTTLVRFNVSFPGTSTTVPITGVNAGENLIGIDFRPQTGQLYGLGVNAVTNAATLYLIDPQSGVALAIGLPGSIAFVDAGGVTPIDLPDPAVAGYGFDFNPTVDRIRVVTGSGLNFRVNPNNGAPVDGNAGAPGVNTDAAIQGSGATGAIAAAYTNNYGRSFIGAQATTLYTLDAAQNRLFIQEPANGGTQVLGVPVTLSGATLDFSAIGGFDISSEVSVATTGTRARGQGYAVLTVGGVSTLFNIDLTTGQAYRIGTAPTALVGLTVAQGLDSVFADGFE
jgi:hypothetical protein